MLNIGIQFFGGRGGGGSGGARGGGRAGGGGSDQAKMNRLTSEGMSVQAAQQYISNEKEIASLQRELQAEMSSTESNHSVGWRENTREQISTLQRENERLRYDKPDPSSVPVGTRMRMGNYEYTKNSKGTWTTYLRTKNTVKRVENRTNADIKRIFT